jgi:hypothetical protein
VLPEDVVQKASDGGRVGRVEVGGRAYAELDLGRLLGTPDVQGAHVLLDLPRDKVAMPVALRTGACLRIVPPQRPVPLGRGLFRARQSAIVAAFIAALPRRTTALLLDPTALFDREERDAIASLSRQKGADKGASP